MTTTIRILTAEDIQIIAKYADIDRVNLFLKRWLDPVDENLPRGGFRKPTVEKFSVWILRAVGVCMARKTNSWRTFSVEDVGFIHNRVSFTKEQIQDSKKVLLDILQYGKGDSLTDHITSIVKEIGNE